MPAQKSAERLGDLVAGKYRIQHVLGEGGMGVVYAVKNEWTGREVAMKVLHPELNDRDDLIKRFFTEAQTASSLQHPNVVDILDMGQDTDGSYFMVLELLKGEPLLKMMRRVKVLSLGGALNLLLPVMDALQRAHDLNIVHRDLKPDNIFLAIGHGGEVIPKLLDFGVAKVQRETTVTQVGDVFGTAYYMAPEQAAGISDISGKADVWSMAVILFECLTGELPYTGRNPPEIIGKILKGEAPKIRELLPLLPPHAGTAMDMAFERDPDDRCSMSEFAAKLRNPEGRLSMPMLYDVDEQPTTIRESRMPPEPAAPQVALPPLDPPSEPHEILAAPTPALSPMSGASVEEEITRPVKKKSEGGAAKVFMFFLALALLGAAGAIIWMSFDPVEDRSVEVIEGGLEVEVADESMQASPQE